LINSDTDVNVNQALVDALTILQHRGQDAAGIVTIERNHFHLHKANGTVADVFTQETVINLKGNVGIGHCRYPTAGGSCSAEAQPLYTNTPFGIALVHNGNLVNTDNLNEHLRSERRHINTNSDSELLLNVFAEELQRKRISKMTPDEVFDTVRSVMRRCHGGYAVIMLINRIGLVAFRDPYGIRPLCYGTRVNPVTCKLDYAVASESVAIDALDPCFKLERDVAPGECIFITPRGNLHTSVVHTSTSLRPCLFEYVYFARPDSIIDGISVYEARLRMGEKLAKKIIRDFPKHDIDVVMPIPETSRTSALQVANIMQLPYREGFIKNRYIARTFIMPGQEMRRKTVRLKLNTIKSEFHGKNVLLIDDSIVRGTTSKELVMLAKESGAAKVYFASAAPPVRFPNVYGIDIPTTTELIAHERNEQEIAMIMGADRVMYNDLDDVIEACTSCNPDHVKGLETSCFDGVYITEGVTSGYLAKISQGRGKTPKKDDSEQNLVLNDTSPKSLSPPTLKVEVESSNIAMMKKRTLSCMSSDLLTDLVETKESYPKKDMKVALEKRVKVN